MTTYWCEYAILGGRGNRHVAEGVLLVEHHGQWTDVQEGVSRETAERVADENTDDLRELNGVVLPGLADCHSHAFHRALRGRTHGDGGTFWTWRDRMYAVAEQLDPENYLALARAVYAEMACSGVTAVGEFHYVHHQPNGEPYENANAMGDALRTAAREAGIRLTLLDTCYLHGGLDAKEGHSPLNSHQQRFGDGSVDGWAKRHAALKDDDNTVVGVAIHSVRAVSKDEMPQVVAAAEGQPLHAHVSEQPAENEAAEGYYGKTPIELLQDAGALGTSFSAVHATHLTDGDIEALGSTTSTACFCPLTERDLADGIGPARALTDAGATISLGSDQHAIVDMLEEARALEMHERLVTNDRGRFTPSQLLDAATAHQTIGWDDADGIQVGQRADAVAVSLTTRRTAGSLPDQILLAATAADVTDVISSGEPVVTRGQHRLGDVGELLNDAISPFWTK